MENLLHVVLVCGSRQLTPGMVNFIRQTVARAKELNYQLVIGDAEGVDFETGKACVEFGVHFMVVGIQSAPRFQVDLSRYTQIMADSYRERDKFMVDCADQVIGIWNGRSPGTKAAVTYAISRGKPAKLYVNFTKWEGQ